MVSAQWGQDLVPVPLGSDICQPSHYACVPTMDEKHVSMSWSGWHDICIEYGHDKSAVLVVFAFRRLIMKLSTLLIDH